MLFVKLPASIILNSITEQKILRKNASRSLRRAIEQKSKIQYKRIRTLTIHGENMNSEWYTEHSRNVVELLVIAASIR